MPLNVMQSPLQAQFGLGKSKTKSQAKIWRNLSLEENPRRVVFEMRQSHPGRVLTLVRAPRDCQKCVSEYEAAGGGLPPFNLMLGTSLRANPLCHVVMQFSRYPELLQLYDVNGTPAFVQRPPFEPVSSHTALYISTGIDCRRSATCRSFQTQNWDGRAIWDQLLRRHSPQYGYAHFTGRKPQVRLCHAA